MKNEEKKNIKKKIFFKMKENQEKWGTMKNNAEKWRNEKMEAKKWKNEKFKNR